MRSAGLVQCLGTWRSECRTRALKDIHRALALKQRKMGIILQISKLNSFGHFGLSFMSEEITVNQSFFMETNFSVIKNSYEENERNIPIPTCTLVPGCARGSRLRHSSGEVV